MPKIQDTEIHDMETLIKWVFDWQEDIYIRVQRDGKWTNSSFAAATNEERSRHLSRWLEEGIVPVKVNREMLNELESTGNPV